MGTGFVDTGGGGGGFGAGGVEAGGATVRVGVEDAGIEDGGGDDTGTGASLATWAGVADGIAVAWLAFPTGLVLPQPATATAASKVTKKVVRICLVPPSSGH